MRISDLISEEKVVALKGKKDKLEQKQQKTRETQDFNRNGIRRLG